MSGEITIHIDDDEGESVSAETRKSIAKADAAAAEAYAAQADLARARAEVHSRTRDSLDARLMRIDAQAALAADDFRRGGEEGDFIRQQNAQSRMAALEAERAETYRVKGQVEAWRPPPADPVEAMAANLSPRSAAWVREHRDIVSSSRGQAKVQAAHNDAIAEGLQPDSDAYFNHINRFVGVRSGARGSNRGSAGSASGGGTEVRLTPGEARAATNGSVTWQEHDLRAGRIKSRALIGEPIGTHEFARRKLAMQGQGFYDRIG